MKRQVMALAFAFALMVAGYAQAFVIDNFDDSNDNTASDTGGDCQDVVAGVTTGQCVGISASDATKTKDIDTNLPGVVGGTRDIMIKATSTITGKGFASYGIDEDDSNDMSYSNPSGFTTLIVTTYDADDTQGNFNPGLGGGAGVDLTDAGVSDTFRWVVTSLDLNLLVTVLLEDADGTRSGNAFLKLPNGRLHDATEPCASTPIVCVQDNGDLFHTLNLFNLPAMNDPATSDSFFDSPYTDPFGGDFSSLAGANTALQPTGGDNVLDLEHIVAIRVIFDTSQNAGSGNIDIAEDMLDTTTIVPEPGTVLLMGTGLLGIGLAGFAIRRTKRRSS
jgi:hypothetical protein